MTRHDMLRAEPEKVASVLNTHIMLGTRQRTQGLFFMTKSMLQGLQCLLWLIDAPGATLGLRFPG